MDFSAASLADPQSPPGEEGAGDRGLDLFSFVQPWLRGNICNQNKKKKSFWDELPGKFLKHILSYSGSTTPLVPACSAFHSHFRHLVVINHIIISKHLGEGEGGREIRGSRQKCWRNAE